MGEVGASVLGRVGGGGGGAHWGAGGRRVKGGRNGPGLSATLGVLCCGQAGVPRDDGGGRR
jgi:hypothetical protein